MTPSRISPPPTETATETQNGLTSKQLVSFQQDGYLIIPDYISQTKCQILLDKTYSLLRDFDLKNHPMTKFVTGNQDENGTSAASKADSGDASDNNDASTSEHVGDDYFLTSGDKVRFFFEEDAFSKETGELVKPKERAINKIGHNLHGLVPEFGSISHAGEIGRRNAAIAKQLGYTDPRLLQSMVICKQPEIGGAVPPHQDSTFLYTDRPSAVGFWIALEDATVENGCLSFAPGSHRRAGVRERFVRKNPNGTTFDKIPVGDGQWPRNLDREIESDTVSEDSHNKKEEYVLGEVKAGTLVLIHGNILHKSEKNLSQKGRIIYTFHLIEGDEKYDDRNWLQIPGGPEAFTKLDGTVA